MQGTTFRFCKKDTSIVHSIIMVCSYIHVGNMQLVKPFLDDSDIGITAIIHHISTKDCTIIVTIVNEFDNLRPQVFGMYTIFCNSQFIVSFLNGIQIFRAHISILISGFMIGDKVKITYPHEGIFPVKSFYGNINLLRGKIILRLWICDCFRLFLCLFLRRFFLTL